MTEGEPRPRFEEEFPLKSPDAKEPILEKETPPEGQEQQEEEEKQKRGEKIQKFFDGQINKDSPTNIVPEGWTPRITEEQKKDYRIRAFELDEKFMRDILGAGFSDKTPRQEAERFYQDLYESPGVSVTEAAKRAIKKMKESDSRISRAAAVGMDIQDTIYEKTGVNYLADSLYRGMGKAYIEIRARSLARKEKREAKTKK